MDLYDQESYHKEDCSDNYSNTNNERALRQVNYPAEETSGASLQRFEVVKGQQSPPHQYGIPNNFNYKTLMPFHRPLITQHILYQEIGTPSNIEEYRSPMSLKREAVIFWTKKKTVQNATVGQIHRI